MLEKKIRVYADFFACLSIPPPPLCLGVGVNTGKWNGWMDGFIFDGLGESKFAISILLYHDFFLCWGVCRQIFFLLLLYILLVLWYHCTGTCFPFHYLCRYSDGGFLFLSFNTAIKVNAGLLLCIYLGTIYHHIGIYI